MAESRGGRKSLKGMKYPTNSGSLFMLNVTSDLLFISFLRALISGFVVALQIYLAYSVYV